jgi:hypothetical protein
MINWRCIAEVGFPTDGNKTYLVTDGTDISTTEAGGQTDYRGDGKPTFKFKEWVGDDNTGEDNSCCSGERYFDMCPTHWCPTDEIKLP